MPITIPRETLSRLVNASAEIAKPKGPAIVQLATITCANGLLTVAATDLKFQISRSHPVVGDMEAIQVDAHRLREVAASMLGDTVKMDVRDGWLHLKASGTRKIAGVVEQFDPLPIPTGIAVDVDANLLRERLSFVAPNITNEDARADISDINFRQRDGGLYLAAIGGSGTACSCIKLMDCGVEVECTADDRLVKLLNHIPKDGDVRLTFGRSKMAITWAMGEILIPVADGEKKFANYMRPWVDHENHLHVRAEHIKDRISAIAKVSAGARGEERLTLSLSDSVLIHGQKSGASGSDPIDAEWRGGDAKVSFNASYMEKCLSGFGDAEVHIGIKEIEFGPDGKEVNPKVMTIIDPRYDDRFAYLMPMRSAN